MGVFIAIILLLNFSLESQQLIKNIQTAEFELEIIIKNIKKTRYFIYWNLQ